MAYIYQIVNKVNGKIYVGKTEHSIEKRFKEHCSDYKKERNEKRPLYAAMRKYGIENFEISLLEETNNPDERETFWIEYKKSFKYGYNATLGGDGKKYIDYDVVVATYNELQNMVLTAQKLQISTDTVKTALEVNHIPIKSSAEISRDTTSKVIKMFSLNGDFIQTFPSLKDAARYIISNNYTSSTDLRGISVHIRNTANGKRKTAYQHIWKWE